jgi:hypothetical protein
MLDEFDLGLKGFLHHEFLNVQIGPISQIGPIFAG